MKNILYVSLSMYPGGAEAQVRDLALQAKQRGWRVSILVLKEIEAFQDIFLEAGIPIYSLGLRKNWKDPIMLLGKILELFKFVSDNRPEVVHSHMSWANIFSRLFFSLFYRPRIICTAHNTVEGGRLLVFLYKLTNSLSFLNTNVSRRSLDEFIANKSFSIRNSKLMYNGINFDNFNAKSICDVGSGFSWVSVGRLSAQKNHELMLKSFARYLSHYQNDRLILVGGGELEGDLKSIATDLEIADNVDFIGATDNVGFYLNKSNAFIMTSKWEGMPLSIIEALAVRLPCIVTDVGGVSEICSNNSAYRLCDMSDESIVKEMLEIRDDCAKDFLNADIYNNSVEVRERFSIMRIFDLWEGVYNE